MNRIIIVLALALPLTACGGATEGPSSTESAGAAHAGGEGEAGTESAPEPAQVLADGSRVFGGEPSERDAIELATILAAPADFDGQTVKTAGEISAVCAQMGCWMELRADAESPGIRVPMANHAFYLPRDVVGARATIEGVVHVEALDASAQEHLESEGAQAADSELSIEASSVVVHP